MDKTVLATRLRRIRQAADVSQVEMASALGLKSASAISKIESANRTVSATELHQWATTCGTTSDAILKGEPFVVEVSA